MVETGTVLPRPVPARMAVTFTPAAGKSDTGKALGNTVLTTGGTVTFIDGAARG